MEEDRNVLDLLPVELMKELKAISEKMGCNVSELIDKALRQFIERRGAGSSVYLSSPINALVEGLFVENTTMSQIKEHGDFGLGTFNYLDGEMVLLDGIVYQVKSNGGVYAVDDSEKSPFACVTFFRPDTHDDIGEGFGQTECYAILDRLIPSQNMLYAVRIDGLFEHVRTRAVPKSENYMPLVEATKDQPVFDFSDTEGSMIGFYTPLFMKSLNAPGYHLHFLTHDRKRGGHVIECLLKKVRIGIQHVPMLEVGLPLTLDFLTTDFSRDIAKDLDKAER